MKKLIVLGILATASVFADVKATVVADSPASYSVENGSGYVSLGVGPLPSLLPIFGIGGRLQRGYNGFDASVQAGRMPGFTLLKENVRYLYYFTPNLASQLYAGAGVSLTQFFQHGTSAQIAAQFVVGKEYTNDTGAQRFFEAQIDFPTAHFDNVKHVKHNKLHWDSHSATTPLVVVSYGIRF